ATAGGEDLGRVAADDRGVGGSFDGQAGARTIQADGSDHGRGAPVAGRGAGVQTLTSRRAPAQPGQVGFRTRFVEEDEPRRVEAALAPPPRPPRFFNVRPLLLAGTERLFLYVRPIFLSA